MEFFKRISPPVELSGTEILTDFDNSITMQRFLTALVEFHEQRKDGNSLNHIRAFRDVVANTTQLIKSLNPKTNES